MSWACLRKPRHRIVCGHANGCAVHRRGCRQVFARAWRDSELRHVVDSRDFSKECLDLVFDVAQQMETVVPGSPESKQLEGYCMATLFYEPSTRTRLSFEAAMGKLGGVILSTESAGEFSSAAKGETLEDTVRTVEGYADCLILRHFSAGSAAAAASVANRPIISAGDGPGQHPTQALLDVYTIRQELGRLENFKIAMIGDLLNGRTVHSLAYLLSKFDNVEMVFVSPEILRMKPSLKEHLSQVGVKWREEGTLEAVASEVDVLYQTRIQKERFLDQPEKYDECKGKLIIDEAMCRSLQEHAVIMHPLPRVDEITVGVDSDPRAAYFRQAKNGLYVRMALLRLCLLGK
eukprot:jgi/Ulvmu1/12872/UM098_0059.1